MASILPPSNDGRHRRQGSSLLTQNHEQGRYEFADIYSGSFEVKARHPEQELWYVTRSANSGGDRVDLVLDEDEMRRV